MRRRSAKAFEPCWEFVTWISWVKRPPGCMLLPEAGSNRSCMYFGTATCTAGCYLELHEKELQRALVLELQASIAAAMLLVACNDKTMRISSRS